MTSPLPYNRQNALASSIARDNAGQIAGKIILTTGVSPGGLGATFVSEIAKHNPALLILAGRNLTKIQKTVDALQSSPETKDTPTRVLVLDLASQKQIHEAADEVLKYNEEKIDVLVNSAGVMGGPFKKTAEGIELQFGSNHIGHFLFTNLIMSKLLAAPKPRVVNVSSAGYQYGGVRFADVNWQDGKVYGQWAAYGGSKTANILFSKGLEKRLGGRLGAFSLHPGVNLETGLSGAGPEGFSEKDIAELTEKNKVLGWTGPMELYTLDECAATHVVAAFDSRIESYNGAYLADGNLRELQPPATDPEDVDKLWKLSEELVGQKFEY